MKDFEPFELRAERLLGYVYRGIYHCPKIHKYPGKYPRWVVNHLGRMSTFDYDLLTRLVIGAHHFCLRASVEASGPGMVKIVIHNRHGRTGDFFGRHPTIKEAIEKAKVELTTPEV